MKAKLLVVLTIASGVLAISSANVYAQGHGHGGGGNWNGGNWHGGNWHGCGGSSVFIGGFGFPFWGWGYPIGYPYGYGYYPYGPYPYGYGYGGGYYGGGYYGGGYSNAGYANYSYNSGYSYQSRVVRLQQQLARAGYYHGAIDGIMGSRTRYALRAYQHDHGTGTYGMANQ